MAYLPTDLSAGQHTSKFCKFMGLTYEDVLHLYRRRSREERSKHTHPWAKQKGERVSLASEKTKTRETANEGTNAQTKQKQAPCLQNSAPLASSNAS